MSLREVGPDDEDRVFYRKPWWQKVIIMTGGPFMNFVQAFVLFAIVLMGFGVATLNTTVSSVPECVLTVAEAEARADPATGEFECRPGDQASPAAEAGLRPGDEIVSVAGVAATDWETVSTTIRAHGDETVDDRGQASTATRRHAQRGRSSRASARASTTRTCSCRSATSASRRARSWSSSRSAPYPRRCGTSPGTPRSRSSRSRSAWSGSGTPRSATASARSTARSASSAPAGSAASSSPPTSSRPRRRSGACWRWWPASTWRSASSTCCPCCRSTAGTSPARSTRRPAAASPACSVDPIPGYFDVAKLLPVAYAVAILVIGMSALLLYADIVNPVKLPL